MCCVEWFAGTLCLLQRQASLDKIFYAACQLTLADQAIKNCNACSPRRHITFLMGEKFPHFTYTNSVIKLVAAPYKFFNSSDGDTFVCRLKRRLKFRYIMAVQKGRENWCTVLLVSRLSGHRNFTEQIGMPNANLRPRKVATKVTACL